MSERPADISPRSFARGEERHFFDAAREGAIGITRCRACGAHFLPRVVCPRCWSQAVEPVRASGRGTVHSFTVLHRAGGAGFAGKVPYTVLLVDLEEGVRVLANLIGDAEPRIGMAVRAVFETRDDGVTIPQFEAVA